MRKMAIPARTKMTVVMMKIGLLSWKDRAKLRRNYQRSMVWSTLSPKRKSIWLSMLRRSSNGRRSKISKLI